MLTIAHRGRMLAWLGVSGLIWWGGYKLVRFLLG
jgi:hypothetical protein